MVTEDGEVHGGVARLGEESGIVGWVLVLIILGAIFLLWIVVQILQAIF